MLKSFRQKNLCDKIIYELKSFLKEEKLVYISLKFDKTKVQLNFKKTKKIG